MRIITDATRTLAALGYDIDPIAEPLSYPGRVPAEPAALLLGGCLFAVDPADAPIGRWRVGGGDPLDEVLAAAGAAPLAERVPVLAVGSNAAPAQLARKLAGLGTPPAVPLTAVRASGLAAGVSAHLSRPGYLPATPVAAPGETADLMVTWLDPAALRAIDLTEPNYHRVPASGVTLPGGRPLAGCRQYVSKHGCLLDRAGRPRRLTAQRPLISGLLADLPRLGIDTPEDFVAATRADQALRDRVRELIRAAGLARS